MATSGKGGIGAFIGVCIVSAAFGTADGHVQGGMVGDLSLMCPEFILVSCRSYGCAIFDFPFRHRHVNSMATLTRGSFLAASKSFMAGLAASGTLTSALRLITKAAFDGSQDGLRKGASK